MHKVNLKKGMLAIAIGTLCVSLCACGGKKAATDSAKQSSESQEEQTAETSTKDEKKSDSQTADASEKMEVTIASHTIESVERFKPEDGEEQPFASVTYQTVEPSDEMKAKWPKLSASILEDNEFMKQSAYEEIAAVCEDIEEQIHDEWLHTTNENESSIEIIRADDQMFCYLTTHYSFHNGPHPNTGWTASAYDTKTGERLPLSDVVTDMKALPKALLDNLEPMAQDDESAEPYEFSDEENEEMLPRLNDYVADGAIAWVMNENGLEAYFDAYALQYYAFGPIVSVLPYEEYGDLLVKDYIPTDPSKILQVKQVEGKSETKTLSAEDRKPYMGKGDPQGF